MRLASGCRTHCTRLSNSHSNAGTGNSLSFFFGRTKEGKCRLTAPSDSLTTSVPRRRRPCGTLRRRSAGNGTSGHAGGGGHDDWNQPGGRKKPWRRCPRSRNAGSAPRGPEGSGTRGGPPWKSPRSWRSPGPASIGTCPRQKATNPDTGVAPPYPCLPGGCTGWGVTSGGCLSRGSPGRLKPQSARREGPMIEPSPVRRHMTRRHDPVRLCDGQPADDDDIPATDIDALRDARAEATLCPVCQQNSHIHDYSLRPDRYQDGRRTLAHLYTVPVQYAPAWRDTQLPPLPGKPGRPDLPGMEGGAEVRAGPAPGSQAHRQGRHRSRRGNGRMHCHRLPVCRRVGGLLRAGRPGVAGVGRDRRPGPGPGAPYPGDPRASGGAALKWRLKGLPALFQ